MRIKVVICVSLLGWSSLFAGVFALTKEQKGIILENFQKIQKDVIFDGNDLYFDDEDKAIFGVSDRMSAFNALAQKVRDKRQYLEKQNESIAKRIVSLEDNIKQIDDDILEINKQVTKTNEDVVYTKNLIETNQKAILLLSKKIEQNRKVMLEYMVHIYKRGNDIYEDDNIDNLKTILLSGNDVSEVMNDLYFKGVIELSGQKLIEQHRSLVSQLYVKKVDLESQENSLKALRKSLMIEKKMLDEKKDLKKRLLEVSKGTADLYQRYINEKIQQEQDVRIKELEERIKFKNSQKKILEKYGCEYIDISVDTIFSRKLEGKCLELNKILYAESKLKRLTSSEGNQNVLDWPVYPYYGISAYYHDAGYKKEFNALHNAIDLVTPQGTSIRAPADGYVIYINPPTTPDYAFVALKHADGYVTVYGHINEVLVGDLEFVKKGEVFAKTGGEYGTSGAGILTTGPHLHFEVFRDEQAIDPLEVLDTSYLSFKELPEKYQYKFYDDFKYRKGVEYALLQRQLGADKKGVFKLEGNSEIERQKYLLTTYAAPAFTDWNMWVEEALDGSIDPTFLMCIGLAESSLGRNLTTAYNVGNVGNTDGGGRWDFPNARTGVMWIVKTLNNKILGKYNEVQLLSRYGNKDGSIYASDPIHWHNNIIKCMSHIKQKYIPDDYNFRLE